MRRYDTLMNPEIEGLLDTTDSKFALVVLGARRARQITSYFGQLGEGLGASVPPQITSTSSKPLSIAFEEVSVEKIVPIETFVLIFDEPSRGSIAKSIDPSLFNSINSSCSSEA